MAGIYIHIPFCKQACNYCDFHFSTSLKNKSQLVESIIREIEFRKSYLQGEEIRTIYFGGGTPSILSQDELLSLFDALYGTFNISKEAEITLEANPDDLTVNKLKDLKSTQVNRLSIGIQSFSDLDLSYMNRAHNASQAFESVKRAQDAGISNISIDLIYGTPTMNDDQWDENLDKAFSLGTPHISCYCLTVEPRTALASAINKGITKDVDENIASAQFQILTERMSSSGYTQYEISNFCKDDNFSKHNSAYWKGEKYLGLGPSAHSFDGNSRQWNITNNPQYISSISKGTVPFSREELTREQKHNEYILTTLRTIWGLDLSKVRTDFGDETAFRLQNRMQKYINKGHLRIESQHGFLTQEGKLFADAISADLFL